MTQTTPTLSNEEMMAIQMLQTNPEAFAQVSRNGSTVDLGEVFRWYTKLVRNLEFGYLKRRGDYVTVEVSADDLPQEQQDPPSPDISAETI